jgi:hypothetical protein
MALLQSTQLEQVNLMTVVKQSLNTDETFRTEQAPNVQKQENKLY